MWIDIPLTQSKIENPKSKILLVDHNAEIRADVDQLLSGTYTVQTVADGVTALSAIENDCPDLVLTDVTLPGLDRFELLRWLRSQPITQDIPIILLSDRAGEASLIKGLRAGADDYLIKPFSARELLARIEASLKLAQLRQEATARERTILERVTDAFLEMDRDFRFTYANEAAQQVSQTPLEALLGKTMWECFPATVGSQFEFQYRRSLGEQIQVDFEEYYAPLDLWVEVHVYPSATGLSVFFRDINDRKRADLNTEFLASVSQALAEAASVDEIAQTVGEHLQRYLRISACAFVDIREQAQQAVIDQNWHQPDVPSLIGVYSIPEFVTEEFLPKTEQAIVVRDVTTDPRIADQQRYKALSIGAELNIPLIRDGTWTFSLTVFHQQPYNWRKDEIEVMQELTDRIWLKLERARAEAKMRESEEKYRNLFNSIDEGFCIIEMLFDEQDTEIDYRFLEINSVFEQQTGLREAVGKTARQLVPDLEEHWIKIYGQVALTGEPVRFENGSEAMNRWFDVYACRLGQPNERKVATVFKDISAAKHREAEHKRIEAQREQLLQREQIAREAAETANRIKDEFLAVLSHELRTPMNPILGWAGLLKTGKLNPERTATAIATIERNAKLQVQLIEDLLDISRILSGKLTLNSAPVDLKLVITAALETVRLAADAKAIAIQTTLSPAIGFVNGDAGRLQQVVWNLLSNAIKFTPERGQVSIELTIGTHAQIQVADTGKGIDPKFLPYVFEHFRQEDGATTRKFGGLGLGLAIARQIVELHGGQISANSLGEGRGATFTVRLPLAAHVAEVPSSDSSLTSTRDLSNIHILVVDDEPDSREFVAFVLSQAGAIVTSAASGLEALQTVQQVAFDLIVSDIGMPEIDGYMLMQQVRALDLRSDSLKQIPAIALTAYAGEANQRQAIAAGFQQHLSKPIDSEALITAVTTLIRKL